jgi:DNA mismatch repair protein MutS2
MCNDSEAQPRMPGGDDGRAWSAGIADAGVPDLLEATPRWRIDRAATQTALQFAFAGSSSGGLFVEALEQARLPASRWDPAGYADDLFLASFVRTCFDGSGRGRSLTATSHLVRLLALPPEDGDSLQLRRGIVAELLESAPLCGALERLHDELVRFRNLVEATSAADRLDPNRRQLEILASFQALIEHMATGFAPATSGLSRLVAFAERVAANEAFRALTDLLRFDDELATVSFKVRIGADGRVRDLKLLSVEESGDNPFVSSPVQRWQAKVELLLRGFRFGDGEVMARLLDAVFDGVRDEFVALVQLLGDIELYLGAMSFRDRAAASGLTVSMPELGAPSSPRRLLGLFNPLLLGAETTPVPCDVTTDRHDTTVLITGPNSGGKTRLLQALGLAQLLAQGGLCVPARAAQMALSSGLLVSLIQTTRVDQTEGRLGVELMRIRSLFERLPVGAIVMLDELCSGTNPSEGEEIFELVLRMLTRLRPQAFITTHFLRFAARLQQERELADLRFLQVALGADQTPTYQFTDGVAATSLAAQAASRLGVTGDQLLALIERRMADAGMPGS